MDMSDPFSTVCPTLDGPVLSVLAGFCRDPLSARDVARLVSRGSWSGVRKTLHRLAEQGVVRREEAGNVQLYTLNREHLAAPSIERLADLRGELIRRLTDSVHAWTISPRHASIFGSAARGDGDLESDVDLFVVRPAKINAENATWRQRLRCARTRGARLDRQPRGHLRDRHHRDGEGRTICRGKSNARRRHPVGRAPLRQLFNKTRAMTTANALPRNALASAHEARARPQVPRSRPACRRRGRTRVFERRSSVSRPCCEP